MTTSVPPPSDGLQRALREAQRRRLHSAGLSSSVLAVGCAAVLALSTAGGSDVLGQDSIPRVGGPAVELVPVPPSSPEARTAPADAGDAETSPDRPLTSSSSPAATRPTRQPRPAAHGAGGAAPVGEDMTRDGPHYIVSPRTTCTVGERTLCSGLDLTPADRGFRVSAYLCSHGPAPVRLRFPDGLEVDLVVGAPGAPTWRWSDGRVLDPGPRELRLEQGQCWQWTTTYAGQTSDGGRLPDGVHRMTALFRADDLGDAAEASADFSVRG